MVNCRYTVTADIYEDLIELQIRLKNRTPSQQLKFWGLNVGFLIAAILFLLLELSAGIRNIVPVLIEFNSSDRCFPCCLSLEGSFECLIQPYFLFVVPVVSY